MSKASIDLRFNEIRDAIKDISKAFNNSSLSTRAIAVLICDSNKDLKITQVEGVLRELPRLERKYLKNKDKK